MQASFTQNHQSEIVQFLQREFKKYRDSADFVAFKLISERTRDYSVRNTKTEELSEFLDQGVLIEIMLNGHIGYGATSELTPEGIAAAFKKARAMTERSSQYSVFKFDSSVRPPARGHYETSRKIKLDKLSLSEIFDFLKTTSGALKKSDAIITAVSDAMLIECSQSYLSSVGAEFHQEFDIIINSMSATASDGKETQTRSLHGGRGNCLQAGAEFFNLDQALTDCSEIADQAIELLSAMDCPSETCDLILAPDQMLLQIHESIGHPLELDRILGDERNFAGWSFVQPQDFGQLQYGSPLMNVVFDPTVSNEMASYSFDEVGNKAEKKYLIQNGQLLAGLGSLESQARSHLSGVANARSSSWNRAPIDRMANINLEGGSTPLDEMIAQTERGVIMYANRSWSIDDYRRKFQFGCEYGKLIENGKVTKTLKNPNYRGITVPFWNSLKALTPQTETYGSPYCGKGEPSQVIRVGHSSPYALFKNIEVFGGG
ncbi:TldD/PmbA family protein [Pseudobdellovibrio exovorus]|uniref:Zn-dependent protease n=1 Tax=Pseudobdellovibrio exovorus JSS TaxID=1184267 RepID=M4V686_9BACT|nr:TldD/PmbA family protein [Pseudobdellovibrio exovorus]AGH94887.1 Zn-dependent protease [Pseudobdellovibrio exovorus JSS]